MVTGTLWYRKHVDLPPEAVILVQLVEVAHEARPDAVVAELRCLPSAIDARQRYVVRASITVGGVLRFATSHQYAVLTRGAAPTVDLLLSSV